MVKFYSKALLIAMGGVLLLAPSTANAQETDLSGVYTLTANGFTKNTGAIPNESTIRIYKAENEDGEESYYLYGIMNRSNNVSATYDATASTLSIDPNQYVYGSGNGYMMTMIMEAGKDDEGQASTDPFVMNVASDGNIAFENTLSFWNYQFFVGLTEVEGITGGKLTKQASPATLTSSDLTGSYTFKANDVTTSDVTERLNSNIKTDEFTLTIAPAEGENQYTVSGLFGTDASVTMTYYPEAGLLTTDELNSLYSNKVKLASIEGDDDEDDGWNVACMFSNLNFITSKAADGTVTLTTISQPTINVTGLGEDEDDNELDGQAYVINGGTATKAAATSIKNIDSVDNNNKVEVYTTDGRLIGNGDASKLGLNHGIYIVKNGKKTTKVAL